MVACEAQKRSRAWAALSHGVRLQMGRVQCGLDVWNVEEKDGSGKLWLQEAVEEVHSALLGLGQA